MSSTSQPPRLYKCIPIPPGDHNDPYDYTSLEMVVIHNAYIRAYNSLIYYSGTVEPGTKRFRSFLAYCEAVNRIIHHHHDIEETVLFPFLESKLGPGTMSNNVSAHAAFETHLKLFRELVAKLKETPGAFDLTSFRHALYSLMDPLHSHLTSEIETIRPQRFKEGGLTLEDLAEAQKRVTDYALKGISITVDAQIVMANGDESHASWFPPIPQPMYFIMKYVVWHVHADMWQFGCCNKHMQVKPEFLAYEPDRQA